MISAKCSSFESPAIIYAARDSESQQIESKVTEVRTRKQQQQKSKF